MISYEEYAKIRDSKGMKDGKVAELAGFGRSTFSDWKNCRSFPKFDKLIKIAEVLGCDPSEFLSAVYGTEVVYRSPEEEEEMQEITELYGKADSSTKEMVKRLLKYAELIEDRK